MILGIMQARMASTRLPGKTLAPIMGRPVLELELERAARSKRMDNILVATTTDSSDDPIVRLCDELTVDTFRGSMDDVLDRYYQAAREAGAEHVVRLTGDCPLADPQLIDDIIEAYEEGDYDIVTNTIGFPYPDGLDTWVFSAEALETAWEEAVLPSHREHVTLYIQDNPDRFRVCPFDSEIDLSHERWTIDEPGDLDFVRAVYEALYPGNPTFGMQEVLDLLDGRPELRQLNAHYIRNEGLQHSMAQDEKFRRSVP